MRATGRQVDNDNTPPATTMGVVARPDRADGPLPVSSSRNDEELIYKTRTSAGEL